MHFSSVLTREDASSLPVPETKSNGPEGNMLGQLVITPEVVASKINNNRQNIEIFRMTLNCLEKLRKLEINKNYMMTLIN